MRSASMSTFSRFLRQEGVGGADVTKNWPRKSAVSSDNTAAMFVALLDARPAAEAYAGYE